MENRELNFRIAAKDLPPQLAAKYPDGARTIDLIRAGDQTTVTCRTPIGDPGDVVLITNTREPGITPVIVKVKAIRRLGAGMPRSSIAKWSRSECLSVAYLMAHPAMHSLCQTVIEPLSWRFSCR